MIFQTPVGLTTSVISQRDDSTVPEVTYAMSLSFMRKVYMVYINFVNHVNLQLPIANFPVSYCQAVFQAIALYFKPYSVFNMLDQCRSQARRGVMALHVFHCSLVTYFSQESSQFVPSSKLESVIFLLKPTGGDASQNMKASSKSDYQTAKAVFDIISQCDTSWQLKPQSDVSIKPIVLRNSWMFNVKNALRSDFLLCLCASPCFCSTYKGKEAEHVAPLQAVPGVQAFPTASRFKSSVSKSECPTF